MQGENAPTLPALPHRRKRGRKVDINCNKGAGKYTDTG
ncbi:hypothetical protein C4K10_0968 [Pseudomonas chlororaphis subsp. aureofaciens]|nr:hypothetical protein C4K21_0983 [Pseudomonas chlororaphis subsp. aurantiaca]AZD58949.1 hypothetical protein C4K18_0957 [Pseudomonas chlororaphis subsp. aurantiaca]AZD96890.1 hypothetical protein C4K12_1005 [Pseudomonas chlororaphis subsp. aureofaciens]AZE09267.1 hypothetical protein C4K10_0968 [Pseudomonas chlororaphis subsp. aureofaciens]AZE34021.1 hypothetical protein C4K06_0969 [Pseudomonas chlororaphis subsp. aureofaciens]